MKKRVFMYLRVSEPSLLNTQEKVLKEYCRQNDWEVVKAFSDLNELLEAVKSNAADIVLVDTVDRLGENKNIFASYNVELISIA